MIFAFLAIGLFLGCAMKRYKLSSSTAVAIILVTYFMSVASTMQENMGFLRYFTLFKYFDAVELFRNGAMEGKFLLLSAGIVLLFTAAAYRRYNQRDL